MGREALLAAGDRNLAATLAHFARGSPDATVELDGRLLLVSLCRTWPGPYHNGVLRLDPGLAPARVLERADAFFAGRSPAFCLWIAAHADGDLERAALDAGYADVGGQGSPRMVLERPLAPAVAPAGVTLEEVVDEAGLAAYRSVTIEAFADSFLPPHAAGALLHSVAAVRGEHARAVVAFRDGKPVAGAMSVADGELAGIQLVGTVPPARGRGLGELVTRWAADAGFASGARAVVLEASEQGAPVYRRMGFVEISRYRCCLASSRPHLAAGHRRP